MPGRWTSSSASRLRSLYSQGASEHDIRSNPASTTSPVDLPVESPGPSSFSRRIRDTFASAVSSHHPPHRQLTAKIPMSASYFKEIFDAARSSLSLLSKSITHPLAFSLALAALPSSATALPSQDTRGSTPTAPGYPRAFEIACAVPLVTGVIGWCLTYHNRFTNSNWCTLLGCLSLMASILWTFMDADKSSNSRTFLLALCWGLVPNFILQLCIGGSSGRLLWEVIGAILAGFSVVALLLKSLFSERATVPSTFSGMVSTGYNQVKESPLELTTWAILVKVAFYTCDAVQRWHAPRLSDVFQRWRCGWTSIGFFPRFTFRRSPGSQGRGVVAGRDVADERNIGVESSDHALQDVPPRQFTEMNTIAEQLEAPARIMRNGDPMAADFIEVPGPRPSHHRP